jgi:hypothetical protein
MTIQTAYRLLAPRAWASSPDARSSQRFAPHASDFRSSGYDDWVLGCPSSLADLGDGREHYRHASRSGATALFELRNAGELAQALELAEAMRDRPSPREAGDEG